MTKEQELTILREVKMREVDEMASFVKREISKMDAQELEKTALEISGLFLNPSLDSE